mmetsp:Transcript_98760/g.178311  ORF Transcript_98760/g.178311 Transcript_98760/m.178311 type:complete len:257 (-) Transcript_98760:67-837(-)
METPRFHLGKDLVIGFSVERRVADQEHKHDHAATPQVGRLVVGSGENLRGHIVRRSCLGRQHPPLFELAGQAKVDDLQRRLLYGVLVREQEVLRLEVPMTDFGGVHIANAPQDLLHHDRSLNLCEALEFYDAVEKLSTCTKLHDEVDIFPVLKGLVELDYIWMVQKLHEVYLLLKALLLLDVLLGDGLHCPVHFCVLVRAHADGSIGALAQLLLIHGVAVLELLTALDVGHDHEAMAHGAILRFGVLGSVTSLSCF